MAAAAARGEERRGEGGREGGGAEGGDCRLRLQSVISPRQLLLFSFVCGNGCCVVQDFLTFSAPNQCSNFDYLITQPPELQFTRSVMHKLWQAAASGAEVRSGWFFHTGRCMTQD